MKYILLILFSELLISCNDQPQPIAFGVDNCEFCKMTIMDQKFGGEIVTKKGKVFKFDSIECMVQYMKQNNLSPAMFTQLLVIDHTVQGSLIKATAANYLRSENLSSPMSKGLSAYSTKEELEKVTANFSGEVMNWNQVYEYVR